MEIVLLTPQGTGAIAACVLAGADSRSILQRCCGPMAMELGAGGVKRIGLRDGGETVDDALLVCLSDEVFELHLHGGMAVVQEVRSLLERLGGRWLEADGPDGRAVAARGCGVEPYRYGIGAEILAALPQAGTSTAVELLAQQLRNGLGAWVAQWAKELSAQTTPLWQFASEVQWLLERSKTLRFFLEPPRVAIIGPPNAGKSTLANALLGRPVSITSAIPGTTRDWVDAVGTLATGDVSLTATFVDTAGVRATADPLEYESIRRSHAQLRRADAVIVVVDGTDTAAADRLLEALARDADLPPGVIALNKSDRAEGMAAAGLGLGLGVVPISALRQQGIAELVDVLMRTMDVAAVNVLEPFAFTARQRDVLDGAALASTHAGAVELLTALQTAPAARGPEGRR